MKTKEYSPRNCLDCGPDSGYMDVLLFLGFSPDGYVCNSCNGYIDEIDRALKKLAVVIS